MEDLINKLGTTWIEVLDVYFAVAIIDEFVGNSHHQYISFPIPVDEETISRPIFVLLGHISNIGRPPKVGSRQPIQLNTSHLDF